MNFYYYDFLLQAEQTPIMSFPIQFHMQLLFNLVSESDLDCSLCHMWILSFSRTLHVFIYYFMACILVC